MIQIGNSIYKEYDIVLLPTKEVSNIVLLPVNNCILYNADAMRDGVNNTSNRHLYIIVDEALQESEIDNHLCIFRSNNELITCIAGSNYGRVKTIGEYYKIIATTDTSLEIMMTNPAAWNAGIKTMKLPQLPQDFIIDYISEYNKNNIITKVLLEVVKYIVGTVDNNWEEYRIKLNNNNVIIGVLEEASEQFFTKEQVISLCTSFFNDGHVYGVNKTNDRDYYMYSDSPLKELLIKHFKE